MLERLATRDLNECTESPPSNAIRTTAHGLRVFAEIPGADSELNVRWDLPRLISPEFDSLVGAQGSLWFERARALLSAPTTLVVEVLSEDAPNQTMIQMLDSTADRGKFKAGSVTARQVRFDGGGRATCERRVTVENSSMLQVPLGSTRREAAKDELGNKLGEHFRP